jgi:rhodanese-related sulfurtransferase
MNYKLLVVSFLFVVVAYDLADAQEVKKISNEELVALMKQPDLQLIDVRTPEEVSFGIIEGAQHIDYYDPEFASKMKRLNKDKPVVVYCAAGGRSAQTGEVLKNLGFNDVYDLTGGFRHWQEDGHVIEKLK